MSTAACPCTVKRLYRRENAAGRWTHVRMCQSCYRCRPVAAATLSDEEREAAPKMSHAEWKLRRATYEKRARAQRRATRQSKKQQRNAEFWRDYRAYLRGDKWADRRARKLALVSRYCPMLGRRVAPCEACGTREATVVHHLNYRYVYNEPLFDLAAVCPACHKALHRLEREAKK